MSNTIGENIRKIRQKKKISQDRLSKKVNLTSNTTAKLEARKNPNLTFETLQIAKTLAVSLDVLTKV